MKYAWANLDDVAELLISEEACFFDTETLGLYGVVKLAQFYQASWKHPLLVHEPDLSELKSVLSKNWVVMQNAHYDITTIRHQSSSLAWLPERWDDTLYLARLALPREARFDLMSLAKVAMGTDSPYYKLGLDKKEMQKKAWNVDLLSGAYEDQLLYAAADVFALRYVYELVSEVKGHFLYQLDKAVIEHCWEFQDHGMAIDQVRLKEELLANEAKLAGINLPINSNSYKQVREYLDSSESDALALIHMSLSGDSKAQDVLDTRRLLKTNNFLLKYNAPRIFGKFQPSARSGRFTCKDQNLQQIPRKLKHLFVAPEGKVLVYSDYSQLELRCVTAITGEARMAELFTSGADLHMHTAERFFGQDCGKEKRFIAKTANFGLLYGAGASVLRNILLNSASPISISEAEAWEVINKWRALWPAIYRWQKAGIKAWERGALWQTPFGRKYMGNRMTDHLNICNQGFGAEIAKLALHKLAKKLPGLGGKLVNFCHDSYTVECSADEASYTPIAKCMGESLVEAWKEGVKLGEGLRIRDVPMPVTVYVGSNWDTLEEDNILEINS